MDMWTSWFLLATWLSVKRDDCISPYLSCSYRFLVACKNAIVSKTIDSRTSVGYTLTKQYTQLDKVWLTHLTVPCNNLKSMNRNWDILILLACNLWGKISIIICVHNINTYFGRLLINPIRCALNCKGTKMWHTLQSLKHDHVLSSTLQISS